MEIQDAINMLDPVFVSAAHQCPLIVERKTDGSATTCLMIVTVVLKIVEEIVQREIISLGAFINMA